RPRSFELALHFEHEETRRTALQLYACMELCKEMQRYPLHEHVVADIALDTEATGTRVQRRPRAELQGVRCDREVRFAHEAWVVAGHERDGDALELGEIARPRE